MKISTTRLLRIPILNPHRVGLVAVLLVLMLSVSGCSSTSVSVQPTMPNSSAGESQSASKSNAASPERSQTEQKSAKSEKSQSDANEAMQRSMAMQDAGEEPAGSNQSTKKLSANGNDQKLKGSEPATAMPMTDQEEMAKIDRRLSESLAAFQRTLQLQQEKGLSAHTQVNESEFSGDRSEDAKLGRNSELSAAQGMHSRDKNSSGLGMIPANTSNDRATLVHRPASEKRKIQKLAGDYDEVVARQLLEAAENEPDPGLRRKLFDEYQRYTGNPVRE